MRNEKRLIRGLQQGDRRAWEEFVDTYGAQVHRLVRRYVTNPADAEDITQEIFVDIHRNVGGFRGEAALSTWVYRVAVNRCFRHCQRKRPETEVYEESRLPDENWQANPAQSAVKRELAEAVQGAVQALSPLHQDVVILCEMHGLTYQECADALDIPVGTVKSRLSNAFRRLRESLRGYATGEGGGAQGAETRESPVERIGEQRR